MVLFLSEWTHSVGISFIGPLSTGLRLFWWTNMTQSHGKCVCPIWLDESSFELFFCNQKETRELIHFTQHQRTAKWFECQAPESGWIWRIWGLNSAHGVYQWTDCPSKTLGDRSTSSTSPKKGNSSQRGAGGLKPVSYFLTCFGDVDFDGLLTAYSIEYFNENYWCT